MRRKTASLTHFWKASHRRRKKLREEKKSMKSAAQERMDLDNTKK
jgi:hypothetical protein